jgi:hypothetical protein
MSVGPGGVPPPTTTGFPSGHGRQLSVVKFSEIAQTPDRRPAIEIDYGIITTVEKAVFDLANAAHQSVDAQSRDALE